MNTNKELLSTIREGLEKGQECANISANISGGISKREWAEYKDAFDKSMSAIDRLEAQQQPDIGKLIETGDAMAYVLRGLSDVATILASAWHAAKSAAPSQQQPKRLTDEEIERIAVIDNVDAEQAAYLEKIGKQGIYLDGMMHALRYTRDNGHIGGLSVDEAQECLVDHLTQYGADWSEKARHSLRARLTAKLQGK